MKYCSTLIVVTDMERSKQFYRDLLGLEVLLDFGANVTLTGGIALQTAARMDVPVDYVDHCLGLLDGTP